MTSPAFQAALDAIDAEFGQPRMAVNSVAITAFRWTIRAETLPDLERQIGKLSADCQESFWNWPARRGRWWICEGVTIP